MAGLPELVYPEDSDSDSDSDSDDESATGSEEFAFLHAEDDEEMLTEDEDDVHGVDEEEAIVTRPVRPVQPSFDPACMDRWDRDLRDQAFREYEVAMGDYMMELLLEVT